MCQFQSGLTWPDACIVCAANHLHRHCAIGEHCHPNHWIGCPCNGGNTQCVCSQPPSQALSHQGDLSGTSLDQAFLLYPTFLLCVQPATFTGTAPPGSTVTNIIGSGVPVVPVPVPSPSPSPSPSPPPSPVPVPAPASPPPVAPAVAGTAAMPLRLARALSADWHCRPVPDAHYCTAYHMYMLLLHLRHHRCNPLSCGMCCFTEPGLTVALSANTACRALMHNALSC